MLVRLFAPVRAPMKLAETEVAVRDERTHPAGLGEGQRLPVVGVGGPGIEPVGMDGDIAEQVQGQGGQTRITRNRFGHTSAQLPRLVQPAQRETGASQREVCSRAVSSDDTPRRLTLEEVMALLEPVQRLARLAELCKRPCGGGDGAGQ